MCINCLSDKHLFAAVLNRTSAGSRGVPESTPLSSILLYQCHLTQTSAKPSERLTSHQQKDATASNGNRYVKTSSTTSASVTTLSIIPVKVKAHSTDKIVEAYAFLDSGSNITFCTEGLLNQLNVKGKKAKISLTTLQGENQTTSCSVHQP